MDIRRIFGTLAVGVGVINILDFMSPLVPGIGPAAFIVGGLFIGAGLWLLAPREGSGRLRWDRLRDLFRGPSANAPALGDGPGRSGGRLSRPADPLLAVRVLRLASERGGRLSIAQTAMELNTPIDSAEAALDECVAKGIAFIDVNDSSGMATYRFPEFDVRPAAPD